MQKLLSAISDVTQTMHSRNLDKGKEVSEDEVKELEENVQKLTDKYIKDIDKAIEEKSKEIMTV